MNVSLRRVALLPLLAAMLTTSCSSDYDENLITPKPAQTETAAAYNYSEEEYALLGYINEHRSEVGLPALQVDHYVCVTSGAHNDYMMANNAVNHDHLSARITDLQQNVGANAVGENLAYNFNTVQSVLNAWLQSPEHRQHIEGDFTHFGLSIKIDAKTGKRYFTNIFINK